MIKYSFKKIEITIIDWEHLVTHSHQVSLGQLVNYWENEIQLRKWRKYRWQSERNTVDKMRKILLNVFIREIYSLLGKKLKCWNDDLRPRPPCHLHPSIEPWPTSHPREFISNFIFCHRIALPNNIRRSIWYQIEYSWGRFAATSWNGRRCTFSSRLNLYRVNSTRLKSIRLSSTQLKSTFSQSFNVQIPSSWN